MADRGRPWWNDSSHQNSFISPSTSNSFHSPSTSNSFFSPSTSNSSRIMTPVPGNSNLIRIKADPSPMKCKPPLFSPNTKPHNSPQCHMPLFSPMVKSEPTSNIKSEPMAYLERALIKGEFPVDFNWPSKWDPINLENRPPVKTEIKHHIPNPYFPSGKLGNKFLQPPRRRTGPPPDWHYIYTRERYEPTEATKSWWNTDVERALSKRRDAYLMTKRNDNAQIEVRMERLWAFEVAKDDVRRIIAESKMRAELGLNGDFPDNNTVNYGASCSTSNQNNDTTYGSLPVHQRLGQLLTIDDDGPVKEDSQVHSRLGHCFTIIDEEDTVKEDASSPTKDQIDLPVSSDEVQLIPSASEDVEVFTIDDEIEEAMNISEADEEEIKVINEGDSDVIFVQKRQGEITYISHIEGRMVKMNRKRKLCVSFNTNGKRSKGICNIVDAIDRARREAETNDNTSNVAGDAETSNSEEEFSDDKNTNSNLPEAVAESTSSNNNTVQEDSMDSSKDEKAPDETLVENRSMEQEDPIENSTDEKDQDEITFLESRSLHKESPIKDSKEKEVQDKTAVIEDNSMQQDALVENSEDKESQDEIAVIEDNSVQQDVLMENVSEAEAREDIAVIEKDNMQQGIPIENSKDEEDTQEEISVIETRSNDDAEVGQEDCLENITEPGNSVALDDTIVYENDDTDCLVEETTAALDELCEVMAEFEEDMTMQSEDENEDRVNKNSPDEKDVDKATKDALNTVTVTDSADSSDVSVDEDIEFIRTEEVSTRVPFSKHSYRLVRSQINAAIPNVITLGEDSSDIVSIEDDIEIEIVGDTNTSKSSLEKKNAATTDSGNVDSVSNKKNEEFRTEKALSNNDKTKSPIKDTEDIVVVEKVISKPFRFRRSTGISSPDPKSSDEPSEELENSIACDLDNPGCNDVDEKLNESSEDFLEVTMMSEGTLFDNLNQSTTSQDASLIKGDELIEGGDDDSSTSEIEVVESFEPKTKSSPIKKSEVMLKVTPKNDARVTRQHISERCNTRTGTRLGISRQTITELQSPSSYSFRTRNKRS